MSAKEIAAAERAARSAHPSAGFVVSCQRTEAYSAGPCDCAAPLRFTGPDAVRHLAEVAAGLHSVVLGERQILGQVRSGLAAAPPELRPAVDMAVAAARALRRRTRFNSHAGALLDRGIHVAGLTPRAGLLVLGTGQMARLVAGRAARLGFTGTVLAGRTAPVLPPGARFLPLSTIADLDGIDVIAGCLGSGAGEIHADRLPAARLLLDLGTPRNFAPEQRAPVITLAMMLADEAARPHAAHRREALRRELEQDVVIGLEALARNGQSPIGAMRAEVERIRRHELARMRRLHPELPPDVVDSLTRALVNQLFHRPTMRLRESGDPEFARRVADLFSTVDL